MDKVMKVYYFNRSDKLTFKDFKTKVLVVGAIMGGFNDALKTNLDVSATCTSTHTQAIQEENTKKKNTAWNYLQLALSKAPLMIVQRVTSRNPYEAWRQLIYHYEPTTIEAYTQV